VASVLAIEDDLRIREVVTSAPGASGHAVRTEARGADGLTAAVDWKLAVAREPILLETEFERTTAGAVGRLMALLLDVPAQDER
jgi:CheY-like chemotaxis protein